MDNQKIITLKQEEEILKSKIEDLTKKIKSKKGEKILGFIFIGIGFLLMLASQPLIFDLILVICGVVTIIHTNKILNISTSELESAKSRIQQINITPLVQPVGTTTAAMSTSKCATCSKEINDWHYEFESIGMTPSVGMQCSGCGRILCKEHTVERCEGCGGESEMLFVYLEKGPAYSSMVEDARRREKYNRFILAPTDSNRVVIQK